jgi:CCR4-NOT transcription complex subunit 1
MVAANTLEEQAKVPAPAAAEAKQPQPQSKAEPSSVHPQVVGQPSGGPGDEGTVIPHLGAYVTVNATLALFQQHPQLKAAVPVAVERSVTIACITTKELVVKDFALEGSELKMRKAAQLMVSNLAGSLAVVTCKETLRLSMGSTLRALLVAQNSGLDPAALDQAVQTCSVDNLDLGCMLIEKAATEAAVRDIEEALAGPLNDRRKAASQGLPHADALAGKRYPNALPEMLRPTRAGLGPQQLSVYEAFARQPRSPPQPSAAEGFDMQQFKDFNNRFISVLEKNMDAVKEQAGGRAVSLGMLGPDHEVTTLIRRAPEVIRRINAVDREAAAFQFGHSIFFKKIVEEGDDLLKLECYVGILAALKDECKKLVKDMVGWISFLPLTDEIKVRFM